MKQRFFYTKLALLAALVIIVFAAPATAGRDCSAAKETIDIDYENWIEFADKIKPLVEEHSKNNFEILELEIEIMNLRIKAVAATTEEERRSLVDQYKTLEQEVENMERDEPRKTYYEDWETLMNDKEELHSKMNKFINDCPLDP